MHAPFTYRRLRKLGPGPGPGPETRQRMAVCVVSFLTEQTSHVTRAPVESGPVQSPVESGSRCHGAVQVRHQHYPRADPARPQFPAKFPYPSPLKTPPTTPLLPLRSPCGPSRGPCHGSMTQSAHPNGGCARRARLHRKPYCARYTSGALANSDKWRGRGRSQLIAAILCRPQHSRPRQAEQRREACRSQSASCLAR